MFGTDINPSQQPIADSKNPGRPSFKDHLRKLAMKRGSNDQQTPTNDVSAAFKEGVRSPIREAS